MARQELAAPDGPGDHHLESETSMSTISILATNQITTTDAITIVLAEPDGMPSSVIIHWPSQPTMIDPNPRALAVVAASIVRTLAEAQTRLAAKRRP